MSDLRCLASVVRQLIQETKRRNTRVEYAMRVLVIWQIAQTVALLYLVIRS